MMYKMSCTVGSGGLSIKPKKIDFFKKTIQSIFLLTKKNKKKIGKILETCRNSGGLQTIRIHILYQGLISDVCKSENKTEIFVICNRNGSHIFFFPWGS